MKARHHAWPWVQHFVFVGLGNIGNFMLVSF
uniref:Uncharacterized protein n=1 Tax=Arundo donax TaxID=35708 RepID=A0A0A8ZI56_ARUDO